MAQRSRTPDPAHFETLIDYLKGSRGFDFTGYKRSTLQRRVAKRMGEVGVGDYPDYVDYLEVHPEEFASLFNTILINVTSFFRDPAAWQVLAQDVIPKIIASNPNGSAIRIWSAGCASGEEPFTLTMLLAEALGISSFRRRVKIYATDVDEEALLTARRATYDAKDLQAVPEEMREKYFEPVGSSYLFRPDLRRSVIFGRHDLVQDAPISRLDLLVCRNVLMYLNAETQRRVLARMHFALKPTGYLFLGRAEMLLTHAELFSPLDLKQRIFSKVRTAGIPEQLQVVAEAGTPIAGAHLASHLQLRERAFASSPLAQLVLDADGMLALATHAAQDVFGLTAADIGRPFQDLELSYRPLELRSLIERAHEEGGPVGVVRVEHTPGSGEPLQLDVRVVPLRNGAGGALGTSITFEDATSRARVEDELRGARAELEQSNEELQSANEELETTNEELQSTNEELETTNEELQSGNEELETMNEELQSTNEELRSMNDQLQVRTVELHRSNVFLDSIVAAVPAAVVVVDARLVVQLWRKHAEDLWGLRADEAEGRLLTELDFGLPMDAVAGAIRACLAGQASPEPVRVEATDRRGRPLLCAVTCRPLREDEGMRGVVPLMAPQPGGAAADYRGDRP